ncbi:MAG: chemotaxis protein CheW [Myxococcaceae bacterium]
MCLLFEAGRTRLCIEATSVVEIAPGEPGGGRFRGLHDIDDASLLFGGAKETSPGVIVLLDMSPTVAVRVRTVLGVVDVAQDTLFKLPHGLGTGLATLVPSALVHDGRLYLELDIQRLLPSSAQKLVAPAREVHFLQSWVDRALVVESGGARFGIPLAFVSRVVPTSDAFCPLPGSDGPVAGLFPHGQGLFPVYSMPAVLDGRGRGGRGEASEQFFVLTELAGQNVGWAASQVLGVHGPFTPQEAPGHFGAPGLAGNVHFLDFQRMFS